MSIILVVSAAAAAAAAAAVVVVMVVVVVVVVLATIDFKARAPEKTNHTGFRLLCAAFMKPATVDLISATPFAVSFNQIKAIKAFFSWIIRTNIKEAAIVEENRGNTTKGCESVSLCAGNP